MHIKVTGYLSGRGNCRLLDSAYLAWRNSQTSQIGPGERSRMCTMQTARAVEDPGIHAEIRRQCIPTQTSHQISRQPLTLQACPTCSRCVTVASSDWRKLFNVIHVPLIQQKLEETFSKNHPYCKMHCISMEWRMVKALQWVPFYVLECTTFSGPSSIKLATSDLIFGAKNLYSQTTGCCFVLLELLI